MFFYAFRPDIVIVLAGNKSDLANRRAVEYEEANGYAEENGLLFMETSAKNANNVNEIFLAIARKLPRCVFNNDVTQFKCLSYFKCVSLLFAVVQNTKLFINCNLLLMDLFSEIIFILIIMVA